MDYNEEIKNALKNLAEVSGLLIDLKNRISELQVTQPSEEIGRLFPFFDLEKCKTSEKEFEELDEKHRSAVIEDLQLNLEEEKAKGIEEIFKKKEIKTLPKLKDLSYRYRKKDKIHEFRYRRNGYNKSFCSRSLIEAKNKAIAFCKEINLIVSSTVENRNTMYNDFAESFMKNVKKNTYAEKSYINELNRMYNHVFPACKNKKVTEITAPFIQNVLNAIIANGNKRTAEAIYYQFKMTLDYAEHLDIIKKNPIFFVTIPLHERENRIALSPADEKIFLEKIKGHQYELHFIIFLYTGCRPCELYSIDFQKEHFLTFRNRKQKKGKIVFKDIPITPMLEPYIERIKKALPLKPNNSLAKTFKNLNIGEQYQLYSLRHTFATRAQECGVPEEVVQAWMGQAPTTLLGKVYTHYTDNFLLSYSKKVHYTL